MYHIQTESNHHNCTKTHEIQREVCRTSQETLHGPKNTEVGEAVFEEYQT